MFKEKVIVILFTISVMKLEDLTIIEEFVDNVLKAVVNVL